MDYSELLRVSLPQYAGNNNPDSDSNRYLYRQFLLDNPDILKLVNHDRLCKVGLEKYVICPEYCCGEFWESKPQFCCSNNFEPIRNLFYFLLAAFVGLLATIAIFLIVENVVKHIVMSRLRKLRERYNLSALSGLPTLNKDLVSSDDTSLEEDSSSLDTPALRGGPSRSRPTKQLLKMHSQSFKDMLKLQSSKRIKVSHKSAVAKTPIGSKSAKSVIDYVDSGMSRLGSATSPGSN